MKTIAAFLLTKTGILRYLIGIAASALIGWGALKTENKEAAIGAGTTLVTLVATALIEKKKDDDTKALQEDVGAKPDGWAGPQTRKTVSAQTKRGGFGKG